jgi:Putative lumazine-binding
MVWDGYCDANNSCRGDLMKRCFHEQCRLTYVDDSDNLQIMDCDSFCHMVTHRYTLDAHKPYEHWKDSARDKTSLISIDFATPDLAMVMLKVGHPPFLWTDLLTCMKIDSARWWIVHKSSCHEDFVS